jgi:hypothetical protein
MVHAWVAQATAASASMQGRTGRFSGHPATGGLAGQCFEHWYTSGRHSVLLFPLLLVVQAVSTALRDFLRPGLKAKLNEKAVETAWVEPTNVGKRGVGRPLTSPEGLA